MIRRQALDVKWKRDTHLPPSEKPALSNPRQHSVLPPFVPPCLLAAGTIRVPSPRFSRQMNPWRTKNSRASEVCQRSFEARQAKKKRREPSISVEDYGAFFLISWAHKVKRTMLGKDQGGQQIKLYAESYIFHSLEAGSTVGDFYTLTLLYTLG